MKAAALLRLPPRRDRHARPRAGSAEVSIRARHAVPAIAAELGAAQDLLGVLDGSGVERVVIVNATSGYGDDNRCMLDALECLGRHARGIARVPVGVSGRSRDALARRGVVGVCVDFISAGLAPLRDAAFGRLVTRLADRDLVR